MQFKWNPSKDQLADKFIIKGLNGTSLTLFRDESYNFESLEHYKNFKKIFEKLLSAGMLKLEGRNYKPLATKAQEPVLLNVEAVDHSQDRVENEPVESNSLDLLSTAELRKLVKDAGHLVDKSLKKPELIALLQG